MSDTVDREAIRRRLDAVADFDWEMRRETEVEHFGDWVRIGPEIMLMAASDLDEAFLDRVSPTYAHVVPNVRETILAEQRRERALIDFLTHAANDLRALLDEADQR